VSSSGSKAQRAMILSLLICSVANADSINSFGFSDKSAPLSVNGGVPLHQYAARLTGVSPFRRSSLSLSIDSSSPIPTRLLILEDQPRQLRTSSTFDRTIDIVLYLYEHFVMGRQRKLTSIYETCRKGQREDHCSAETSK
jgi:hypothetical protein